MPLPFPVPSPTPPLVVGDRAAPLEPVRTPVPIRDTPPPTPPREEPEITDLGGLLFLGGLGSMLLGCVYALFRAVRKKKRPRKGR